MSASLGPARSRAIVDELEEALVDVGAADAVAALAPAAEDVGDEAPEPPD